MKHLNIVLNSASGGRQEQKHSTGARYVFVTAELLFDLAARNVMQYNQKGTWKKKSPHDDFCIVDVLQNKPADVVGHKPKNCTRNSDVQAWWRTVRQTSDQWDGWAICWSLEGTTTQSTDLWPLHTLTTHTHTQLRIFHHRSVMFVQIVSDSLKS